MGEVTISVAGRAYQVICEDGEEDRLNAIAARVDHEAQAFGGATPSLSEARLLLMCSLLLADKLDEAEKASRGAQAAPAAVEVDVAGIEAAAARIEALAGGSAPDATPQADGSGRPEPAPETSAQSERRSKSSAATAAEKDLLSMLDRPETRLAEDAGEEEGAAPTLEVEPTVEAPLEAPEEVQEVVPDAEPLAAEASVEDDEEQAARERAERRARRRERLARLAKQDDER